MNLYSLQSGFETQNESLYLPETFPIIYVTPKYCDHDYKINICPLLDNFKVFLMPTNKILIQGKIN